MNSHILSVVIVFLLVVLADAHQDRLIRINLFRKDARDEFVFNQQFATLEEENHLTKADIIRLDGLNYVGEIQVGTFGKKYRVLLDSGSGDLWLPTSSCSSIHSTTRTYEPTNSYERDGRSANISYGNRVVVAGHLGREIVRLGDLTLVKQSFIQVDSICGDYNLLHHQIDGILGLGYASSTGYSDVEAPLKQMMRNLASQTNSNHSRSMLSLSLNYGPDASRAGELIIGDLDRSRYVGEIAWTPLTRHRHWLFRVESIELNYLDEDRQRPLRRELTLCPHGCHVVADTSFWLMTGDQRHISALNEKIGASHNGSGVFVLPSCNNLDGRLPYFSVSISGRKFSLKPSQYTFELAGVCYSAFRATGARYWILGSAFIGHFYTIIDYEKQQFGLAESSYS